MLRIFRRIINHRIHLISNTQVNYIIHSPRCRNEAMQIFSTGKWSRFGGYLTNPNDYPLSKHRAKSGIIGPNSDFHRQTFHATR